MTDARANGEDGISEAKQIDDIIKKQSDWRGALLAELRQVILTADPTIIEEIKWKKPSKPEGVAVWSDGGIVCMADILKNAVRLTFPKGAIVKDPNKIFNTRLDSKSVRAVDFSQDAKVDKPALRDLVQAAAAVNSSNSLR